MWEDIKYIRMETRAGRIEMKIFLFEKKFQAKPT